MALSRLAKSPRETRALEPPLLLPFLVSASPLPAETQSRPPSSTGATRQRRRVPSRPAGADGARPLGECPPLGRHPRGTLRLARPGRGPAAPVRPAAPDIGGVRLPAYCGGEIGAWSPSVDANGPAQWSKSTLFLHPGSTARLSAPARRRLRRQPSAFRQDVLSTFDRACGLRRRDASGSPNSPSVSHSHPPPLTPLAGPPTNSAGEDVGLPPAGLLPVHLAYPQHQR